MYNGHSTPREAHLAAQYSCSMCPASAVCLPEPTRTFDFFNLDIEFDAGDAEQALRASKSLAYATCQIASRRASRIQVSVYSRESDHVEDTRPAPGLRSFLVYCRSSAKEALHPHRLLHCRKWS